MDKNALKRNYLTKLELTEIFQDQYNDIFSEILNLEQQYFAEKLKKQIIAYLDITKKFASQLLLKKLESIYAKKYLEEKVIISRDFKLLKNSPKNQLDYLDKLNCIIHCPKSKDALHTCGNKFILYGDYVYCLCCKKVYNENQVYMYCEECDKNYYTKLREIVEYNLENYYVVSLSDYHCKLNKEEKIKCPKCFSDLYADILNVKNYQKIEEIFCKYCNLTFNINLFKFKCKKCGAIFKNKAKIYNEFNNKKNELICKIHALCNKKYSFPEKYLKKDCECNLMYVKKYKHNDGGILYEGELDGQRIILCDKCYQIFDYYNYIFSCPLCYKIFKPTYIEYQKINYAFENQNFIEETKIFENGGKNNNQRNNIGFLKGKNSDFNNDICYCKCQCSSNNKNKKSKNIIINNPFSTRNYLLMKTNSKSKSISKTYRENGKEIMNNKQFTQTLKNQNINIKIQNFYNNYVPIIHIIEKNAKKLDKNNDSKNIINRNYTLIHNSPKKKKKNVNISNTSYLKRSITETTKYNLGQRCSGFNKGKFNYIKEDKEKEKKINNNNWNKKKLSSSFSLFSSSNGNETNFFEYITNNSLINHRALKKNKKKRGTAENDRLKNKIKKINNKYDIFKLSKIDIKKKQITRVNTINECKEEYNNEIRDINIKKPKIILKIENNDNKSDKSEINKKYNKNKKTSNIDTSLSLSVKKYKKIHSINEKRKTENNTKKIKQIKSKVKNNIKINDNNLPINFCNENHNLSSYVNICKNKPQSQKQKDILNNKSKQIKINPKRKIIKDFNSEEYNILNIIGEGTFSQIFLVENDKTHEKYALKKMTATKLEDLKEKKKEFELIQQLTTEDENLNLINVYGIQIKKLDKFNIVLYILMEAAISDWETELKNRHYTKRYYSEDELKNILINLVQTFSSLQKKGISHRDVKPQNILCFKDRIFKITDFGEAKNYNNGGIEKNTRFNFSKDTSIQTIRGTELYMSPILFNALRNSSFEDLQYNAFKSDVFSLGLCILLAASLTYKPLSELRDIREMNSMKLLIERHLKERYSQNFIEVLFNMLQLEEKNRPDFIELESMMRKIS